MGRSQTRRNSPLVWSNLFFLFSRIRPGHLSPYPSLRFTFPCSLSIFFAAVVVSSFVCRLLLIPLHRSFLSTSFRRDAHRQKLTAPQKGHDERTRKPMRHPLTLNHASARFARSLDTGRRWYGDHFVTIPTLSTFQNLLIPFTHIDSLSSKRI